MMMLAEKPELNKLLRDGLQSRETETKAAAEDVSVITNLLIAYGIIEEVYCPKKPKRMPIPA
jgi:hypothetical protein